MSQENVDTVREGLEAFNSGDIERVISIAHTDFEAIVPPELSAEPDTYRGHDGLRRYFESFQDAMEEIRFEPEQLIDGGDQVVTVVRLTARGRHTAIPVEQRIAQIWTMRAGKAVGVRTFATLERALEASGLGEQSGRASEQS
jgi:ketosteroid isomerase-like protein